MTYHCKHCKEEFDGMPALARHIKAAHPGEGKPAAVVHPSQAPADDAYYHGYCPRCRVKNRSHDDAPLDVQMCGKCAYLYWLSDGKPFERFPGPPKLTEAEFHERYERDKAGDFAMMIGKGGKWVPRHPERRESWTKYLAESRASRGIVSEVA